MSSSVATVTHDTFPQNPITKWFTVKKQVASSGPEMAWKIFDAVRNEDYKACSIFLFEKSIADKLHKPRRREIVSSMLKREVKLLTQLRHCYLLRVLHPVEETNDTLAFAAEPVFASLANLLGNQTRLPVPVPPEIQKFRFTDLNRKLGIYQITEILRFLHLGQSLFHNNISPGAILVTRSGQWRLASVSFLESMKATTTTSKEDSLGMRSANSLQLDLLTSPWSRKLPKMARPDPHFAAPECLRLTTTWTTPFVSRRGRPSPEGQSVPFNEMGSYEKPSATPSKTKNDRGGEDGLPPADKPGPWSDMFSLGLLICMVYKVGEPAQTSYERQCANHSVAEKNGALDDEMDFKGSHLTNSGAPILESAMDSSRVERLSTDANIPEAFRTAVRRMPLELVEPVEKLLSHSGQKRPSSQLFSLLKFFNDPSMICLDVLLNFEEKSQEDRLRALHSIEVNVNRFPKELLFRQYLPMLLQLLENYQRRLITGSDTRDASRDSSRVNDEDTRDMELIHKLVQTVACIVQASTPSDYNEYVEHFTLDFIRRCKHVEVKADLLRNITAFTKHASTQSIEQLLVPIVCDCLDSRCNPEVQIAAMQSLTEMSGYFQQNDLDDIVLPGVIQAYSNAPSDHKTIGTYSLRTLASLVRQISANTLQQKLIPFLLETTKRCTVNGSEEQDSTAVRHRSKSPRELVSKNVKQSASSSSPDESTQIGIICEIWRNITMTRSNVLEPCQVAKDIFPSILPHVLNNELNLQEFRSVMSSLHALLDCLDMSVAGSEDSMDASNYRIIPAVTIDAPVGGHRTGGGSFPATPDSPPPQFTVSGPAATPKKSMTRPAVPFVPMLHPRQLQELEKSPGMSRRASAHVIFPLPAETSMDAPSKAIPARSYDSSQSQKDPGTLSASSRSFFGLQLPSVGQLRRHSCDARGEKRGSTTSTTSVGGGGGGMVNNTNNPSANGSMLVPKVEIQGSAESLSRRSSENSLVGSRGQFTVSSLHSTGGSLLMDRSESQLLTARVCEGPFISAPSSRPGSRRPSGCSVSNWTIDPIASSTREMESTNFGRVGLLGTELRNVPSARRSSFNSLGDTVMSLLGNAKTQR